MHKTLSPDSSDAAVTLPTIPTAADGERYAGICLDSEGKPTHHLFLLDVKAPKRLAWQAAKDWAVSVGGSLPTRFESALLYANLQSQLDKSQWHWTDTQYGAGDAWSQFFGNGFQNNGGKRYEFAARAVRRLEI